MENNFTWEIIDVDCAWPYYATNNTERDMFIRFVQAFGHRTLIKELKS